MMLRILTLALTSVAAYGVTPAQADSLLALADGKWRGAGWARQALKDPKRATKCALDMEYSPDRNTLSISGKCAGGGRSARVTGRFVEYSPGRYTGQWNAGGGFSADGMSGKRSGNRILMSWRSINKGTRGEQRFAAKWTISKNRISVSFFDVTTGQHQMSSLILQQ